MPLILAIVFYLIFEQAMKTDTDYLSAILFVVLFIAFKINSVGDKIIEEIKKTKD